MMHPAKPMDVHHPLAGEEAIAGDYDQLLQTCMQWVDVE
jgi:hypothetical protein